MSTCSATLKRRLPVTFYLDDPAMQSPYHGELPAVRFRRDRAGLQALPFDSTLPHGSHTIAAYMDTATGGDGS
jgi:hypothetical protein